MRKEKTKVICGLGIVEFDRDDERWCLKPEVVKWVELYYSRDQLGGTRHVIWTMNSTTKEVHVKFKDPAVATLFKLAWGGK